MRTRLALLLFDTRTFRRSRRPRTPSNFPTARSRSSCPIRRAAAPTSVGRALAQQLTELWKVPVVVENKAGAGASLGADFVAKSAPDGYTLLFSDSSPFVINPHVYDKLPFDPLKDLEPVALGVHAAPALAVSNNAPGKNVAELLAYARANPDKLTYASPGVGNYTHVAFEYLKHMAGVKMVHVPYRGTNQVMPDLLSGRVDMFLVTISVFDQYEKDGKLRVFAAATDKRLAQPAEPADHRRDRAGLFDRRLVRARGAGRHAARDPRQDQRGRAAGAERAEVPGVVHRAAVVRGGNSHAPAVHGDGRQELREVARAGEDFGREESVSDGFRHAASATAVNSLRPCGGGLGRGVAVAHECFAITPLRTAAGQSDLPARGEVKGSKRRSMLQLFFVFRLRIDQNERHPARLVAAVRPCMAGAALDQHVARFHQRLVVVEHRPDLALQDRSRNRPCRSGGT